MGALSSRRREGKSLCLVGGVTLCSEEGDCSFMRTGAETEDMWGMQERKLQQRQTVWKIFEGEPRADKQLSTDRQNFQDRMKVFNHHIKSQINEKRSTPKLIFLFESLSLVAH